MEILIPTNLDTMRFAVVDQQNTTVSLHQHPDAAERFIAGCARKDLRVVMLPELPGRVINFDESTPF